MAVRTPDPDPEPEDDGLGGFRDANPPAPDANPGWLSEFELEEARRRLPMLYVEAIPVRTDGSGQVTEIGILLRSTPMGEMTRTIVSGRVRFGETIRDALFRHVENDLGPMAFPLLPPQPLPFTVAEYFPIPGVSAFHDDRQRHAHPPGSRQSRPAALTSTDGLRRDVDHRVEPGRRGEPVRLSTAAGLHSRGSARPRVSM